MPPRAAAQADPAASVTPSVRPAAPWRVREVAPLSDNRIFVRFFDGLTGVVDLSALIASPKAGVFARLRDSEIFAQVRVELGVVVWPGDLDLAPDAMHAAIMQNGEWRIEPWRRCREPQHVPADCSGHGTGQMPSVRAWLTDSGL